MRRTIRIALGENSRSLGTLRFDAHGARESAAVEYHADWLAAADRFAIDPSTIQKVEHAVSQWRSVGRELGMGAQEIDQFADAFEHDERAAAGNASQ